MKSGALMLIHVAKCLVLCCHQTLTSNSFCRDIFTSWPKLANSMSISKRMIRFWKSTTSREERHMRIMSHWTAKQGYLQRRNMKSRSWNRIATSIDSVRWVNKEDQQHQCELMLKQEHQAASGDAPCWCESQVKGNGAIINVCNSPTKQVMCTWDGMLCWKHTYHATIFDWEAMYEEQQYSVCCCTPSQVFQYPEVIGNGMVVAPAEVSRLEWQTFYPSTFLSFAIIWTNNLCLMFGMSSPVLSMDQHPPLQLSHCCHEL